MCERSATSTDSRHNLNPTQTFVPLVPRGAGQNIQRRRGTIFLLNSLNVELRLNRELTFPLFSFADGRLQQTLEACPDLFLAIASHSPT